MSVTENRQERQSRSIGDMKQEEKGGLADEESVMDL